MKSMYYSYGRNKNSCGGIDGPFVGSKGVVGGTEIVIDKDLNPWSYGGYDQMEFVGTQLALNGIRANNLEESGEMQIAEPPAYSLSYFVKTYGLMIQGINVSYSATGVTTTYTFSTKTPRFANYAESIANQIKKVKEARQEIGNFINDIKRKTVSDINTIYKSLFAEKAKSLNPLSQEKTPTALILGGYFDIKTENNTQAGKPGSGSAQSKSLFTCDELCEEPTEPPPPPEGGSETKQRTYDVGIDKIVNGSLQIAFTGDEYKTQIMMSMDGILAPVSIKGRTGTDNRWRASRYFDSWDKNSTLSQPRPPMPPLDMDEKVSINQRYLNPILSTKILIDWDSRKGNTQKGSCIQFLSFNEDPKDIYDDDKREQADDFGFFSLRGPLVLQSWGYDTEGKPMPNAADSPDQAEKGIFTNRGLRNTFMDHWTKNPMTWPVGPIDLRFDRTRGVWVSPAQTERVLVAQLVETLGPYGSAKAILLNPSAGGLSYFQNYEIWGPEGENLFANLRNIKINVYDFLGRSLCANTKVYIVNVDGRYIVIESSAAGDETCTEDECVCTTETETTETTEETTDEPTTDEPTTDEPPTDETCSPCTCPTCPPVETQFMFASMLMSDSDPNCSNVCGLAECIGALGSGPGVLGIDENGCLTLYCTPDCSPTIGEIEF
jgi:hypothetical protein